MRILIAEDSLTQAIDLRMRLESLGHQVAVSGDGKEALNQLRSKPAPVVISDWIMPGMNGPDLCRRIRSELSSPYAYLILLTSKDDRHERLQGLSAGADAFLSKPVDTDELEVALKTAKRFIAAQEALVVRNQELEQANVELTRLVLEDEPTALANQRGFQEALAKSFRQAVVDHLPLSLIRLELDHPHQSLAGLKSRRWAEFLSGLGNLLREECRDCDIPARVSDHGFALILPCMSTDGAIEVAERLRSSLIRRSPEGVPITGSVAVVATTAESRPPTTMQLLELAEQALGQAQDEGGNRVVHLDPSLADAQTLSLSSGDTISSGDAKFRGGKLVSVQLK
jgi:two-component system chemotaxis response regulator CheY